VIRAVLAAEADLEPEVERQLLDLRRASLSSDDFQEAVRAFGEKRPPQWRDR
jgi:enoyl-CoA hydratase/carnithine racemase